jgi:sec-independent protein translocase protein TatA
MGDLSPWHLLIVAIVFVVLFGAKKLPDASRSLGQSLRIFKAETRGLREDPDAAQRRTETTTVSRALPADSTTPVQSETVVTERTDTR